MKIVTLGVGLIGLILLSFGCAVDTAGDERGQSTLTIEAARISRSGEQFLVEGTSQGQPISQLATSVLVEDNSGDVMPLEEAAAAGIKCYSCIEYSDSPGRLYCVRVPCPDGLVESR